MTLPRLFRKFAFSGFTALALLFIGVLAVVVLQEGDSTAAMYAKTVSSTALVSCQSVGDTTSGFGSGFYISRHLLVTCAHVVTTAHSCRVLQDYGSVDSVVLGRVLFADSLRDVAVVYTDTASTPLGFRDGPPSVGETMFAIGNADGYMGSFSSGVVAGLRANGKRRGLVQCASLTEPGGSGGPMIDHEGLVVGMTSFGSEYGNYTFGIDVPTIQHVLRRVSMAYSLCRDRPGALLREGHTDSSWANLELDPADRASLDGVSPEEPLLSLITTLVVASLLLVPVVWLGLVLWKGRRQLERRARRRFTRRELEEARSQAFLPEGLIAPVSGLTFWSRLRG